MTDFVEAAPVLQPSIRPRRLSPEAIKARLRKRYAAERRFKLIGLLAVLTALGLLALLLFTIVVQGYTAFAQTTIGLDITFDEQTIDPDGSRDPEALGRANYAQLIRVALAEAFPEVEGRTELRALRGMISSGAAVQLRDIVLDDPGRDRHHPAGLAARRRRRRPVLEGLRRPRGARAGPPHQGPADRLARQPGGERAASSSSSTDGCSSTAIRASPRPPASAARWSARSTCCW